MSPVFNKSRVQLNKIKVKHRRAYPSAEALMISLVEFAPQKVLKIAPVPSQRAESTVEDPRKNMNPVT